VKTGPPGPGYKGGWGVSIRSRQPSRHADHQRRWWAPRNERRTSVAMPWPPSPTLWLCLLFAQIPW